MRQAIATVAQHVLSTATPFGPVPDELEDSLARLGDGQSAYWPPLCDMFRICS